MLAGTILAATLANQARRETSIADLVVALAADEGVMMLPDYSKADALGAMVPVGVIVAVLGALMVIGYIVIRATRQQQSESGQVER